jgi:hypothetical protein
MVTQIILEGVDENRKEEAETEIREIINAVFQNTENHVDTINVTRKFRETIRDLVKNSEKDYDPHHEYGTAFAKTIPILKEEKLAYIIVLDGNFVGEWKEEQKVFRLTTLAHELVHVADGFRRWLKIGTESFFAESAGKQGWLIHNALIIWEEYDANRLVEEMIEDVAKKLGGKVNNDLILGHARQLRTLLEGIHDFVRQSIRDFRNWKLDPTELSFKITSRIFGALVLCAYLYALSNRSDEAKERMAEIEGLEGYHFLLFDSWPRIQSILEELYSRRREYLQDLIDKMAYEIDEIVQKCGLEMRDAAEGFYLDVRDIE